MIGTAPGRSAHPPAAAFVVVLLLGAAMQASSVTQPLERPIWRESDMAAIARNFHREGMNPLFPRIDWRGNGPGFTEMELPILPWLMALLYYPLGVDPTIGRWLSLAASLATLVAFLALARDRLRSLGALVAVTMFATNSLVVEVSTALRPEALMLLCYVVAVRFFLRWLECGADRDYVVAAAATSAAILAKAPAVHIGVLFAILVVQRFGARAVRDARLWVFATVAIVPSLLWYSHARGLWRTYGNSLGFANKSHWFGPDLLQDPAVLVGLLRTEMEFVWTPPGVALVTLAVAIGRPRGLRGLELPWLATLTAYFILTAATTGEAWASYYHTVAVPVAALTVGWAADTLWRVAADRPTLAAVATVGVTVVLLAGTGLYAARYTRWVLAEQGVLGKANPDPLYACALSFAPKVPPGSAILASGGRCRDRYGRPVGYNKPYMFYWMDRKGFNVCDDEMSVDALANFAGLGARFFVAEQRDLDTRPGLEEELRSAFPMVAQCSGAILFELGNGPDTDEGSRAAGPSWP